MDTGEVAEIGRFAARPEGGALALMRLTIDEVFGAATPEQIEAKLESAAKAGLEWGTKAYKALRSGCPLSVATAMTQIRNARSMTLEEALAQEYRFTARCMEHGEFLEGIRAAVIDKDRNPQWAKPRLADVTAADVEAMLAPLGDMELEV